MANLSFLVQRRVLPKALILALATVIAAMAVLFTYDALSAQEDPRCAATALGQLPAQTEGGLQSAGTWSAQDCESEYRPGVGAQYFEFEVVESGRIRIELTSNSADPFLYLTASDGLRIADDDDSGALLNARIERDLAPGTYQIEATTVGARTPVGADFNISIYYVEGCEITPLGALTADSPLSAAGSWSLDTCGSRIVVTHPAHSYLFELPQTGRVRIDLTSDNGDPVVSLATVDGVAIGANDDGGVGLNSRIDQYLPAGAYIIEATTYSQGGLQPAASDFELSIQVVNEQLEQLNPNPKVEFLAAPDQVVSGDPFTVHFRVGNHGGGDLYGNAASYLVLVRGPENRHWGNPIPVSESSWAPGSSYHTGDPAASSTSTTLEGLASVGLRLEEPGRSWVLVALYALNEDDRGLWFHATWKHVHVLESAEFGPTSVRLNGRTLSVAATADADGTVTTTVNDVSDREWAVDSAEELQAIYAAGVRRLLLDEIFARETVTALEESTAGTAPGVLDPGLSGVTPQGASSAARFADRYISAVDESGLAAASAAGFMLDPGLVEQQILSTAESARREYETLADGWRRLQSRVGPGAAITYAEALALHSQLRYAESVLDSAIRAGELVTAARSAESGWETDSVQTQVAEFAADSACPGSAGRLSAALTSAAPALAATHLSLDSQLRAALPFFGTATDHALCAARAIDGSNERFFNLLGIDSLDPTQLPGFQYVPANMDSEPAAHTLRILARLNSDGRIEHAVELADGRIILPERRFLDAEAPPGRTYHSSAVAIAGTPIGAIRSQIDSLGRIVVSFLGSNGARVVPDNRIIPPNPTVGTWLRSSRIDVPAAAPLLAAVG